MNGHFGIGFSVGFWLLFCFSVFGFCFFLEKRVYSIFPRISGLVKTLVYESGNISQLTACYRTSLICAPTCTLERRKHRGSQVLSEVLIWLRLAFDIAKKLICCTWTVVWHCLLMLLLGIIYIIKLGKHIGDQGYCINAQTQNCSDISEILG